MKTGFAASAVRQRIETRTATLVVEALVPHHSDVRQTQAAWDAGTLTNATSFADGRLTLTPSDATGIQQTSGSDNITDLDATSPWTYIAVGFGGSVYGDNPHVRKIDLYIDIQPNTGSPPFDGEFILHACRVARWVRVFSQGLATCVGLQPIAPPVRVRASELTSSAGYVAFTFAQSPYAWGPQAPLLDRSWVLRSAVPQHYLNDEFPPTDSDFLFDLRNDRVLVLGLEAVSATGNTNYALKRDAGAANPYTSGSNRLAYFTLTTAAIWSQQAGRFAGVVAAGTGCPRMRVYTSTYPTTGSVQLLTSGGDGYDLGASPSGTVEFRVTDYVPPGCTGQAYVRVPSGPGAWIAVADGQTPADIGIASQQTYDMKYEMTSDSTQTATPELTALGVVDITVRDLSPIATLGDYEESVDILTGQVKMAEAELHLEAVGVRDYRDLVTTLLTDYHPNQLQIRTFVGGGGLTRQQYGYLDLWDVDDANPSPTGVTLTLVSILNRLRGRFPRASGTQVGYLLKTASSGLSGGADWNRELSRDAETAGSITFTIAASSTEVQHAYTPANVPGLIRWAEGGWTVKVDVTTGNSNIYLGVRIVRVNSANVVQERRPNNTTIVAAEEQQCTIGVKTFTIPALAWSEGAAAGTDRLRLEYYFRNAAGTNQSLTIATGTANTEVLPPWVPGTAVSPVVFDNVYPGTAFETWRDTHVGLPARFRGASPDTDRHRVSKAVLDAEGKRELERIAWLDGCLIQASQGVVKASNLWGPRGSPVAVFPAETVTVEVRRGFTKRLPEFACAWGYDVLRPRTFAGEIVAQHVAAYAAYGNSRVDTPDPRVEDEIARYVKDPALAGEIARAVVLSMGAGVLTLTLSDPSFWTPAVELGDTVAVEVDSLAMKHPVSGEAICGFLWAIGTVIARRGWWGKGYTVWVRNLADLYATTDTVQRRLPYEGPLVSATVSPVPNNLTSVQVKAKVSSSTATIYYALHATGTEPPARERVELWSTYSTTLTILRDASDDRLLSFFARDGGFTGPIATYRIPPDAAAQVTSLSATQSGASPNITVVMAASVDGDTRRVRLYWRKDSAGTAWPTVDGTQSAAVSETYFMKEVDVSPNGGGYYADGGPATGGDLTTNGDAGTGSADLCADTNYIQCIAVPVDFNGNVGTRGETSYNVAAAAGASVAMGTPSVNTAGSSCGALRSYDFSWTPTNVVDGTHDLLIYANLEGVRELIHTEASPNSVTTATDVEISGYAGSVSDPTLRLYFDYELKAGASVVNSGEFGRSGFDFVGQVCF